MSKIGYRVGGHEFKTKKALTEHFRSVRNETDLGARITDTVVLALLRRHPEWDEKTVAMDFVGTAMIKGTPAAPPRKEIAIINRDSSVMDISWAKLVARLQKDGSLKHPTEFWEAVSELKIAARQAVYSQLQPLAREGMHVDHVHPQTFEQLLFDWVVTTGRSPVEIVVEANDGPTIVRRIADPVLRKQWHDHHREHAVLELVSPLENLKRQKVTVDWEQLR